MVFSRDPTALEKPRGLDFVARTGLKGIAKSRSKLLYFTAMVRDPRYSSSVTRNVEHQIYRTSGLRFEVSTIALIDDDRTDVRAIGEIFHAHEFGKVPPLGRLFEAKTHIAQPVAAGRQGIRIVREDARPRDELQGCAQTPFCRPPIQCRIQGILRNRRQVFASGDDLRSHPGVGEPGAPACTE